MAPALVEHSAAQERNSSSKKFLEKLTCIPPIDLVLVDSIKHMDSNKLLSSNFFKAVVASEKDSVMKKENSYCVNNTVKAFTPVNNKCMSVSKTGPLVPEVVDSTQNLQTQILPRNTISIAEPSNTSIINSNATSNVLSSLSTEEKRADQPVAELDTVKLSSLIKQKQNSVHRKYTHVQKSLTELTAKVNSFRLRNVYSHIATNLKAEKPASTSKSTTQFANLKTQKNQKHSGKTPDNFMLTSRQKLCEANTKFFSVYDSVKYLEEIVTDYEEDYDSRVKVPIGRSKRKCEKPKPTPADLRHWKESRCQVGSQCTWLSLQIDALDKKISCLHRVHKKLKSERQSSRTIQLENITVKNETESVIEHNGIPHTSSISSQDDILSSRGACRTSLMTGSWTHKYIRKPDVQPPSEKFKCRNTTSIEPCNLCLQATKKPTKDSFYDTDMLDESFHKRLSYTNEASLSLLVEKKLREEKINTKVTITKSTKKKKRLKPKDLLISSFESKISPASIKPERKRSDEYSRKRTSTDSGSRVRKIRKFSDCYGYDSSKPSTPTNELVSPLSQSLNSSVGFRNKKKLSSTGEYDINNIVIPYSMAASTRVERIQYKEIPTPGWRNIDFDFDDRNRQEDMELTDDDTFTERHARCEILERKRFTNFFHLSMNRRRPRTSEGPNSQPPSPLIVDDVYKSNTGTPADSPSGLNSSKNNSINIQPLLDDERDPPWAFRNFPLPERDFKDLSTSLFEERRSSQRLSLQSPSSLLPDSNTLASLKQVSQKLLETSTNASNTPMASPLLSPSSVSSPSTPASELNSSWTVKVVDEKLVDVVIADKQRKGIVLKLAKK